MVVLKLLYGIAEAGTHQWAMYSKHYKEKLGIVTSTFDLCFLITVTRAPFGLVGMQTDNTLILGDTQFLVLEKEQLKNADFRAKPKEKLDLETLLLFNKCVLSLVENNIVLYQKGQGKKINLVEATEALKSKQGYTEQRARGAYIATICQPKASFDLSVAAQQQDPKIEDIQKLNKRLA